MLRGYRPAKLEFGGMGGASRWQLTHENGMAEVTADEAGNLTLELPAEARVTLSRIPS